MFDLHTGNEQANVYDADLQRQVAGYIAACRQRISAFIGANYSWCGAIKLNRLAWGADILVTPYNFLMGLPNFLLRMLAVALEFMGARKAAQRLLRIHLGLPTTVQKALTARLMADLLDLPLNHEDTTDRLRHLVAYAAQEPVKVYVHTRNVAADITAGTLAAVMGVVFFNQFTPGSVSAGSAMARIVAKEQAVSEFALGDVLGRLYYAVFPVNPSLTVVVVILLVAMATIAVIGAFSGMIHDPIQTVTGIHRRRLNQLLNAIEESIDPTMGKGYQPKDTYFGRVYDLVDWIKGLLTF
ncbi:MAG: hypothetical protein OEQ39_17135 [Gammaproteobacteria bacterium]|nr:hypothetical protein [Gammaproteobacteria bacterium]MDH3468235.1 hypothetical protein [Gammaproteobacteria bacterium]